jgi:hypothetical protein
MCIYSPYGYLYKQIYVYSPLWFAVERTLRLMMVRGGVSLGVSGSESETGLKSFGSETVTSSLHQEI